MKWFAIIMLILIIGLVVFGLFMTANLFNEIDNIGLKTILERIWYGGGN